MKRFLITFFILFLFLWAGEYGRIQGRIVDAKTNEPLEGINVAIKGTDLGATTGRDGTYLILYVPPGRYTLRITAVNYEEVVVSNLIVNADQTTKQDFKLKETVIALPATVVKAERPMVNPTSVATTRIQTDDEIDRKPIMSIPQLIGFTAGVTKDVTGTHLRGGRPDEITYYINGMPTKVIVPWGSGAVEPVLMTKSAVQEVTIMSGGFEAEYGDAISGVINVISKEGKDKIETMVKYTTDEMFQTDKLNYGYNFFETYLGGSVPLVRRLKYFLSGELYKVDDYGPDNGFGYFKAPRPRCDYRGEAHITYSIPNRGKLSINGFHSREQYNSYATSWHFNLPNYVSRNYKSSVVHSILNYRLTNNILSSFKASYVDTRRWVGTRDTHQENHPDDPRFPKNPRRWWEDYRYKAQFIVDDGEVTQAEITDTLMNHFRPEENTSVDNPYGVRGLFWTGDFSQFRYYFSSTYSGKVDIVQSIGKVHELKFGAGLTNIVFGDYLNGYPQAAYTYYDMYKNSPLQLAAYIQDRIDWKGMILRLGLRLDYFNSKSRGIVNPYDTTSWVEAEPDYRFSPRFGFSFPVTHRTKFRFNYGHFHQIPPILYYYSFSSPSTVLRVVRSGAILGNPELESKKTIHYELGFENQINDITSFDVALYFKDIYDLETVREVIAVPTNYLQYRNADYGNVKGFEVSLNRRLANYWYGRLTYTLQYAKGTGSEALESVLEYYNAQPDPVTGEQPPIPAIDFWLDFDERHVFIVDCGLQFPNDFNILPLRDFVISTVTSYHSGQPYTPTNIRGEKIGAINSARKPGYINTDLQVSKDINIGPLTSGIYCSIYNLFNTTQIRSVYSSSGLPDWDNGDVNFSPYQFGSFTIHSSYYHPACDFDHDGIASGPERYRGYMDARHFVQRSPDNYMPSFRMRLGFSIKI